MRKTMDKIEKMAANQPSVNDTIENLKDELSYTGASLSPVALRLLAAKAALKDAPESVLPGVMVEGGGSSEATSVLDKVKVKGVPLRDYLKSKGITLHERMSFGPGTPGPYYDANNIWVGFKPGTREDAIKGITGHEIGHALRDADKKLHGKAYAGSLKASLILGSLGAGYTGSKYGDGKSTAALTALNLLAASPMLHEEIQASRLGSKVIGLKGLKRLRSFVGVPSYLLLGAAPAVSFGTRKLIDKIREKKRKRKDMIV